MDKKPKLSTTFLSLFYTGFSPLAPGTCGSILSVVIFTAIHYSHNSAPLPQQLGLQLIIFITTYLVSIKLIKSSTPKSNPDQQWIVIDEFLGIQISLLPLMFTSHDTWWHFILGFILFRIFDIIKPLGIKKIDNLHTTHSVMLDDIVAGVYTATILTTLIQFT